MQINLQPHNFRYFFWFHRHHLARKETSKASAEKIWQQGYLSNKDSSKVTSKSFQGKKVILHSCELLL